MCKARTGVWMAALPLVMLAACGGGGSGGVAATVPSFGALTKTGHLATVALSDGAVTLRTGQGPLGFTDVPALALDPATGTVYGTTYASAHGPAMLIRIDPTPGARGLATKPVVVGEAGPAGYPSTLVWHPGEEMLYGVQASGGFQFPGRLIRIDPTTGASEFVGNCEKVTTLTYDPVTDAFYGARGSNFHRITTNGSSLQMFSENALLPHLRSLALDPQTGEFHGVAHDPMTNEATVVRIDLFGSVDPIATIDEVVIDLEIHPLSGSMLGLGDGGSVLDLTAGTPAYGVQHRGNLGCDAGPFTQDPADGGYYTIDATQHLVKFHFDGSSRTIGRVDVYTWGLVFDLQDQQLWGIGSETPFTTTATYVYSIDRATAATGMPVVTSLSAGTQLAYDVTNDVIRAISGANDVALELDPVTGLTSLTANAFAFEDVYGLTWNAEEQRLIALSTDAGSEVARFHSFDPYVSQARVLEGSSRIDLRGLAPHPQPGAVLSVADDGDLVETILGPSGISRTVNAVRDDHYFATAYQSNTNRILATTHDLVASIDPTTGATTHLGSTPGDGIPSGITWDSERERIGFLVDDEVRWTGASSPWHAPTSTSLGGRDVRKITFSPENGVFFLLGDDGLFSMARNATNTSFVHVSSTAPPATLQDITWRAGFVWASTNDGHLHRIDPTTGDWVDLGLQRFTMAGLY